MKLNNLSRLTALLLAIVLFLSSIVYAEGLDSSTVTDYESALQGAQASAGTYCTNEYCDELYTALQYTDMTARYNYLKSLESTTVTDTTEEGDTIESTLTYWVLMHYYWICYATTDTAHNFTGDELCNCYIEHETDTVDGILYPYGSSSHAEDCPWYGNARTLTDEATGITVTGVIPADVVLVVGDPTITDTSFVETDVFYSTPTIKGYNISLVYSSDTTAVDAEGVSLAGTKWQPSEDNVTVDVTIPNAWDTTLSFSLVEVYHVTGTDDEGNVTYELFSNLINDTLQLNSDGSATFQVSGFSNFILANGTLDIAISSSGSGFGGGGSSSHSIYVLENTSATITLTGSITACTASQGANASYKFTENTSVVISIAATAAQGTSSAYATYTLTYTSSNSRSRTYTIYVYIVNETDFNNVSSSTSGGMNQTEMAGNFHDGVQFFYWRFTAEEDHTDHPYTDEDENVLDADKIIKTVTYTSENGKNSGTVPHSTYNIMEGNAEGIASTLDCSTVLGLESNITLTNLDKMNGFTLYIETMPGYVVTNYCIRCENHKDGIDGCQTVQNNTGLIYQPSTDNQYVSKITKTYADASPFGHGSNSGTPYPNYVLVITVAQVNINIDVEKTANGTSFTAGDEIQYTVIAENICESEMEFTSAVITDSFFKKSNVSITSVKFYDNETDEWTTLTTDNYTHDRSAGTIMIPKINWDNDDKIEIVYTYTTTDADTAAPLENTVVVEGSTSDASGTATDMGVAYVEVIVNENTKGSLYITKTFHGLTTAQVNTLLTRETNPFTIAVTNSAGNTYDVGDYSVDATYVDPDDSATDTDNDIRVYWIVKGLDPALTYTVTESNYDYSETVDNSTAVYTVASTVQVGSEGTATSGTSGTATVTAGNTTVVNFINTYSEQPQTGILTITKSGNVATTDSFIFNVSGPDNYSAQVVITGPNSVTLTDLPAGEYTVTEDQNWSWRYSPAHGQDNPVTVTVPAGGSAAVTFTNTKDNDKWLSDESSTVNFDSTEKDGVQQ